MGGGEEGGLIEGSGEEWENVLLALETILGRSSQSRLHRYEQCLHGTFHAGLSNLFASDVSIMVF